MKLLDKYIQKEVDKYINDIKVYDKSNKEKLKWKIEIEGERIDDLEDPPRTIPFSQSIYKGLRKEADAIAKVESKKGNRVEIWKLVKRY